MIDPAHLIEVAKARKPVLVDERGNAISSNMHGQGPFFGTGNSREMRSWNPPRLSPDGALIPEIPELRSRANDLARNSTIAQRYTISAKDSVVGRNYKMRYQPDWRAIAAATGNKNKYTAKWAIEFAAEEVEPRWRAFAELPQNVDASRAETFTMMSQRVVADRLCQGDATVIPLWLTRSDSPYKTCFLAIDPARVSTPTDKQDGKFLRAGIELDRWNGATGYYVRNNSPGFDTFAGAFEAESWERIPARFRFGRQRFIHAWEASQTGQTHGTTCFAPVLAKLRMKDNHSIAELSATVANAMITLFAESTLGTDELMAMLSASPDVETGQELNAYMALRAKNEVRMESLAVIPVMPGDKIISHTPARPNPQYSDFQRAVEKDIYSALGIPHVVGTMDFSQTNYSSAQAALRMAERYWSNREYWTSVQWASPAFGLFFEEAANREVGDPLRIDTEDYYLAQQAWHRCAWSGPPEMSIDQKKTAEAIEIRLRSGQSSLSWELRTKYGIDFDDLAEEQGLERDKLAAKGLPYILALAAEKADSRPAQAADDDQDALDDADNATAKGSS